jgi:hypothetical protein
VRPKTLSEIFADPLEPTNNERAAKAAEKVKGYAGEKAEDVEADVVDLLVDHRHYCDAVGLDFGRLNRTARHRHEAEVGEQGLAKKTWEG